MRKLLPFIAGVGLALSALTASADIILVDDFNIPTSGGDTCSVTTSNTICNFAPRSLVGASDLAVTRNGFVSTGVIGTTGGTQNRTYSASIGFDGGGTLSINQGTSTIGFTQVEWTIPNQTTTQPGGPYQLFFALDASQLGSSGNSTIEFSFVQGMTSTPITTLSIGAGATFNVPFALSQANADLIYSGGTLVMKVLNSPGMNLNIDSFSIFIPEPTSLALVGLALVGAGVVSRRRKTATV